MQANYQLSYPNCQLSLPSSLTSSPLTHFHLVPLSITCSLTLPTPFLLSAAIFLPFSLPLFISYSSQFSSCLPCHAPPFCFSTLDSHSAPLFYLTLFTHTISRYSLLLFLPSPASLSLPPFLPTLLLSSSSNLSHFPLTSSPSSCLPCLLVSPPYLPSKMSSNWPPPMLKYGVTACRYICR